MGPESYAIRIEGPDGRVELVKGFGSIAHAEWWIEVQRRHAPRPAPPVQYFILEDWDPSGLVQRDRAAA